MKEVRKEEKDEDEDEEGKGVEVESVVFMGGWCGGGILTNQRCSCVLVFLTSPFWETGQSKRVGGLAGSQGHSL